RTGEGGKFLWPGFGENIRVLRWIHDRVQGRGAAREAPIGLLPGEGAIDTDGLDVSPDAMRELLSVDRGAWQEEANAIEAFLRSFGDRTPEGIWKQPAALKARLDPPDGRPRAPVDGQSA